MKFKYTRKEIDKWMLEQTWWSKTLHDILLAKVDKPKTKPEKKLPNKMRYGDHDLNIEASTFDQDAQDWFMALEEKINEIIDYLSTEDKDNK